MAVTQAQLTASGADFQRVFARMTAAECRAFLVAGLSISNTIGTPPSHLTAEGALSWIVWNDGGGTGISSLVTNKYTATGLTRGTTDRAHLLYDLMSAAWDSSGLTFLTNTGATESRQFELIQPQETLDLTPQITRIVCASTDANAAAAIAAYPQITVRDNLIRPVHTYYNHGAVGQDVLNSALVASLLIAQPAGRRYIHADRQGNYTSPSSVGCMLGIPVTTGAGNGRYAFWDLELTTANRSGLSSSSYRTQIVASDSKLRVFMQELLAAGAAEYGAANATDILDGFLTDIEHHKHFYDFQRGVNGSSTGVNLLSPITVKTVNAINTGTGEITTSVAHGWTTGDAVMIAAATTMPTGLLANYPYYVNVAGGVTKATLYKRRADALVPQNAVNISSTGSGAITATWITETCDEVFADSGWSTIRDSVFQPAGLSQANIWDHANLHVATAYTWYNQNFPFLYDAFFQKYYVDTINTAMSVVLEYFPNAIINAYDAAYTSSLYSWDLPVNPWRPGFGVAGCIGNGSTVPLYGQPTIGDDRWNWRSSTDGDVEAVSGTSGEINWAYFVYDWSANMSMCRASTKNRYPYVGAPSIVALGYAKWGTSGLWEEIVLHATLPSREINFYNDPNSTSLEHKRVVDLVRERDEIALYTPGRVLGPFADTIPPKYLYTKVWCGYRWVSRYTPNPNLSPTWAQVGANVVITYNDATTTTISAATLTTYTGSAATLGFWVLQDADVMDTGSTTFPNKFLRTTTDKTQFRRT